MDFGGGFSLLFFTRFLYVISPSRLFVFFAIELVFFGVSFAFDLLT